MDQPPTQTTTIMVLNDHCLLEVFDFMDVRELGGIADVCIRFRQNAIYVAQKKCEHLELNHRSTEGDYASLRHFGAFFKSIHVNGAYFEQNNRLIELRLIEMLDEHCTGTLIKLVISNFTITQEIATRLQRLLVRLSKLKMTACTSSKAVLRNLSVWSPELRQQQFFGHMQTDENDIIDFELRHTKYRTLNSTPMQRSNVHNKSVMFGPQWKTIEITDRRVIEDTTVQWIVNSTKLYFDILEEQSDISKNYEDY